jgi:riboflavin kinase/FMN adenylyltransferase
MKPVAWNEVRRQAPCVAAMGNFDGVHLGHRRVLEALMREAGRSGLAPVVITYEPHPRYYFKPQEKPSLLTTPREKLDLLAQWPVEVIALAFNQGLATLEAESFIKDFLQERLQGRRFLLGHDHRFGRGARGDAALLKALTQDPENNVLVSEPLVLNGEVVSSSAIRAHLEAGRVEAANRLLGRPFAYSGEVVRGDGRGKSLGFATANIDVGFSNKALAALGVYGGKAVIAGREHLAIANIGINPTFDGKRLKLEVHVLDFAGDLYGQRIEFRLLSHLRPEKKFASLDELRTQITTDIAQVRQSLSKA